MTELQSKPSRWWRRSITLRIPVWPERLAQFLCNHSSTSFVREMGKWQQRRCNDCYKLFSVSTDCRHPVNRWNVTATEVVPTERGGSTVLPSKWFCADCGHKFNRIEQCPACGVDMVITGYHDLFSARFRCPTINQYFFREDFGKIPAMHIKGEIS